MSTFRLSLIAASLLLAGCSALGPNYQRPALQTPATLRPAPPVSAAAAASSAAAVDWLRWWKSFQDPVLDSLLDEAAANNQDLVLAAARIEEARATVATTASNRYPAVDGSISASKTRTSENGGKLPAGVNPVAKDFQLGLSASYEIDFWGKFSRADEAARARLVSQEANRGVVQSALFANLALSYFALRSYDAQLALADAALQTRRENLRLQKKRFSAGSIGELDVHQAGAEVAATEVTVAQAKQSIALAESTLALLSGRTPAHVLTPVIARGANIDTLYGQLSLPTDLPSDLLNRRPDIIAAEQTLIAANADIGQAKAQYFPSVKLVSGIGYESRVLQDLLSPASLLWNLGASLAQPIFRAGAIGAVVTGAEARKTQALAQYVQAVHSAFRDVHDALTNLSANEQIQDAAKRRVVMLKDTLRLADLRYQSGYSSSLEVLNAQRDLLQTQASLIDIQRAHLSAAVNLYKAVGGGWEKPQNLAVVEKQK